VTFVFHAAGGSADDAIGWGLQNVAGAAAAGIFVFPTGIDFNHEGPGWDDRSDGYDLPFFDHMLAELESDWCVDPKSVFVTGFSWGGDFTVALACNRGDKIRAVAAYSTSDEFKDPADFSSYADLPCAAKRHPAILFVHAEDGDDKYPPPYFATTSALLRHLNACGAVSTPAASSPVMACRSYRRCSSPVTECSFEHRLGHTLPPHWAEDTWTFFRSQSR
jgi:poly(3-hydroxybutyrate) depolymerase